jgi:RHH-type proline utilization regulon transcriptional repressor/proline dehydrogenase/delta 1-pyrroline-5-carboxylate dehydrogenase
MSCTCCPATGPTVGAPLVRDRRVAGVAFTGSTEVARKINQQLANREGPIVPLIAETGGQNAMIVDSTALPEQVVRDVVMSAFQCRATLLGAARAVRAKRRCRQGAEAAVRCGGGAQDR